MESNNKELKKELVTYRKKDGCEVCGNPYNLTFHHEHAAHVKSGSPLSIGTIVNSQRSVRMLKAELSKCVVLCRSCHDCIHRMDGKILPEWKEGLLVYRESLDLKAF